MNCRDTRPLLPLFFDGELEARQMRAVALHSTRCPECEGELRQLEHLQDAVATHVAALVDGVDLGRIWAGVAPRLAPRRASLFERGRVWWDEQSFGWSLRGSALAAAAAVLLAVGVWQMQGPAGVGEFAQLPGERIDNSAVLDSVQSSVDSVALVTEPETNTTLLWIMDDAGAVAEPVADELDGLP